MKIENDSSNWAGLTTPRYEAKNAPAIPPNAAPVPYARSLVRAMGIPAQAAADSSSRIATHARPKRESRRWTFTTSASATSASANQYHGRRSNAPKRPSRGSSMRSMGPMPIGPEVSMPPKNSIWRPLDTIWPMISPKASVTIAM